MLTMIADTKRIQQLIKLLGHPVDGVLAYPEQSPFGASTKPTIEAVVDVLNDLERLPKVVASYRE
jgi:hypothetical protein